MASKGGESKLKPVQKNADAEEHAAPVLHARHADAPRHVANARDDRLGGRAASCSPPGTSGISQPLPRKGRTRASRRTVTAGIPSPTAAGRLAGAVVVRFD